MKKLIAALCFFTAASLSVKAYPQQAGLFSRITTTDPSSRSATIAGGVVAGSQQNQIIDFSGRIPALTLQYFVDLNASQLNSVPACGTCVLNSRAITIAGTANEVASSTGAQDLSADRTWTLSLPASLTFTGKTVTGGTFSSPTLITPTIASFINATHNHQAAAGGGQLDHGLALTGLADDDHAQYALLAGRTGGQTLIGGTGTTDDLILRSTSGVGASGSDIIFQVGNNGATEAMRILNSGNVGIGTNNPADLLHVVASLDNNASVKLQTSGTGNASFRFITAAGQMWWQYTNSSDSFQLYDQTTDTFRVTMLRSGNVGIGTVSPQARLHIPAGGIALDEETDIVAPAANRVVVYAKDNGAGKTQIVARFNTGAVQVLATEP